MTISETSKKLDFRVGISDHKRMKVPETTIFKKTPENQTQIVPIWHDPEELRDRLSRPKVSYEEALAQTQRVMSQPASETSVPLKKNAD